MINYSQPSHFIEHDKRLPLPTLPLGQTSYD